MFKQIRKQPPLKLKSAKIKWLKNTKRPPARANPGAAHGPARDRAAPGLGRDWARPGRLPLGILYSSWIYFKALRPCRRSVSILDPMTELKSMAMVSEKSSQEKIRPKIGIKSSNPWFTWFLHSFYSFRVSIWSHFGVFGAHRGVWKASLERESEPELRKRPLQKKKQK